VEPVAATVYGIRLRVGGRLPKRLMLPLVFARNVVVGALGFFTDQVAPAGIEVYRLVDGGLVGAIPAGGSYYDQVDLLKQVRRALATQPPEAFLSTWNLHDS
jgi:hypothetical protein